MSVINPKKAQEAIDNIDKMIFLETQKIENLKLMKKGLLQKVQQDHYGSTKLVMTGYEFQQLKKAYKKAVDEGKEVFTFKDVQLLTAYATYLIEYWDTKR